MKGTIDGNSFKSCLWILHRIEFTWRWIFLFYFIFNFEIGWQVDGRSQATPTSLSDKTYWCRCNCLTCWAEASTFLSSLQVNDTWWTLLESSMAFLICWSNKASETFSWISTRVWSWHWRFADTWVSWLWLNPDLSCSTPSLRPYCTLLIWLRPI